MTLFENWIVRKLLLVGDRDFLSRHFLSRNFFEYRKRAEGRNGRFSGAAPAGAETKRTHCEGSKGDNFDEFHGIRYVIVS
ncbi:MAG: hypothetical protein ACJAVK_001358 [Akkermansiaceae bacterium]|jgi:hypothetical protein